MRLASLFSYPSNLIIDLLRPTCRPPQSVCSSLSFQIIVARDFDEVFKNVRWECLWLNSIMAGNEIFRVVSVPIIWSWKGPKRMRKKRRRENIVVRREGKIVKERRRDEKRRKKAWSVLLDFKVFAFNLYLEKMGGNVGLLNSWTDYEITQNRCCAFTGWLTRVWCAVADNYHTRKQGP